MSGLLDAMIDAHALDPALHELLLSQVPHGGANDREFERRVQGALRLAIGACAHEFSRPLEIERVLFVLAQMLEAFAHAVVLQRPAALSQRAARDGALRAILAYLDAERRGSSATRRPRR